MLNAALLALLIANQAAPTQQPGSGQGRRQRPTQAGDQQRPTAGPTDAPKANEDQMVIPTTVTKHSADLPSGHLDYTATAGQIPILGPTGDVECRMFYVAYTKDGAPAHSRPVTFAFNGGPGSATMWLHMGALGPKRAPMNDDGSLPKPPYLPVDNMDSWIDFTDVVVIDAPATGWSRVMKPEFNAKFFGVREDIAAFTQFVQNWLSDTHRWSSPTFVAGESYGGIRGSGLSNSLFRAGVALSGFVSISGVSNYMTLSNERGNDETYTGYFPSMAATAWYHHKLPARYTSVEQVVAEATDWTDKVYAGALLSGDSLTPKEKGDVAEKMGMYLGLTKKFCLGANLRITTRTFFKELMRDEGVSIGRYDGRLTTKEELNTGPQRTEDPSSIATTAPFVTSVNDYLQRDLNVKTTMPYRPSSRAGWNFGDGSFAETETDLRTVISANPHFHVLYCCGYYDLACPLNATKYTVNHMGLDEESLKQISYAYFHAGHMMYIEKDSRKKLHDDVEKFEADALAGK